MNPWAPLMRIGLSIVCEPAALVVLSVALFARLIACVVPGRSTSIRTMVDRVSDRPAPTFRSPVKVGAAMMLNVALPVVVLTTSTFAPASVELMTAMALVP